MTSIEPWPLPKVPRVSDVAEVRRLGMRMSRARTSEQTAAAVFWAAPPAIFWAVVASEAARVTGLDARQLRTRVAIAVEQATRMARRIGERIQYPTPQQLIRGEAGACIASMQVDRTWEPLLATPPRSEAPCPQCVAAGAAVAAVRAMLEDDLLAVEASYPQAGGVLRRFRTLTQMLQECEDAQVWAGLHLRATAVESTELGLRMGRNSLVVSSK